MMAYPPSYREVAPALPSIIVPGGGRVSSRHHDVGYGRSPAMPIPGIDSKTFAPPALPPPREPLGESTSRPEDAKRHGRRDYAHGSFVSGYESIGSSFADERPHLPRRDTSGSNGDEGYASLSSTDRSSLQPSKFHFQTAADLHCDSMKKKLDPIRTFDKSPPRSFLSTSLSDLARKEPRLAPAANLSVQLPIHSRPMADLGSRQSSFYSAAGSPRSSIVGDEFDRSPRGRSTRQNSDDANAPMSGYDYHAAEDMDMDDAPVQRRRLSDDGYAAAGQKRRAASPPPEEYSHHAVHSQADAMRRRDMGVRSSPVARLSTIPQGYTMSPATTAPPSRSGSFLSNPPQLSGGVSPGGMSPTSSTSPYATPMSLNPSPRGSISRGSVHSRNVSGTSPRKTSDMAKSKLQGWYMCECCPKKPKKFETAEELSTHEAEKQYECSYCGNRFKNKNEAERHQNSLHVRRHSWSCSALSHCDRAFHESTSHPGESDTCGYCGDEFKRSGHGPGSGALNGGVVPRHATEQDWEARVRHLEEVHKFRECNSSKKFYRADHFRQHLKHSHAGTSGKWTNMLENACLIDEDPTQR